MKIHGIRKTWALWAAVTVILAFSAVPGCDDSSGTAGTNSSANDGTDTNSGTGTNDGTDTNSGTGTNDGTDTNSGTGTNDGTDPGDGTALKTCSQYIVPVEVPSYDPSNPEHQMIQSDDDWSHINDPDKRIFFVAPGQYDPVTITAAGTEEAPRIIVLYDGSDAHPASLPPERQANVRLVFDGAAHWVVSRLSAFDIPGQDGVTIRPPSHHIVLDRMNFANYRRAVSVRGGPDPQSTTHHITIQRCRMGPMSMEDILGDNVAVLLWGDPWDQPYHVYDTHILENEFVDNNDGVMLLRFPERFEDHHPVDYAGTVIDCNHFHVTPAVYADGQGNLDPSGRYARTENAIDLKGGSEDPSKPIIVSNNVMWGFRRTDTTIGSSSDPGIAAGGHYDVKNVEFFGNVIFDSNRALGFADPHGLPYSVENLHVHDNIFYDIGFDPDGGVEYAHYFYDSTGVLYERNTIVDGPESVARWFAFGPNDENLTVRCNVIVGMEGDSGTRSDTTTVEMNFYYGTAPRQTGDGTQLGQPEDARLEDLVIETDRYTGTPRTIVLPGVLTTDQSPHHGMCGQ